MAHPQNRNDTPELRLRCLTEFPPRQGTYPYHALMAENGILQQTPAETAELGAAVRAAMR
jgi:hypothetical protein